MINGMFGWHFIAADKKLRYDDGRKIEVGKPLSCRENVRICRHGMHASTKILNAAEYYNGPILCRVYVEGIESADNTKFAGRTRTVLWMVDVDEPTDINKIEAELKAKAKIGKKKEFFDSLQKMKAGKADAWDVYRLMEARNNSRCIGDTNASRKFIISLRELINHFVYDEEIYNSTVQDKISCREISETDLQKLMIAKAKKEGVWVDDLAWLSKKK